jgi:IgA Peptidase M64
MRLTPLLAAALLASLLAASADAQDPFSNPGVGTDPAAGKDESTPDYLKAVELQRKGKWKEAQKAFQDLMKKYPNSVHAEDCELRGGDNCYLGCVKIHESGPPARRIDVSVMGDGFQIDPKQQQQEEDWARLCLEVLYSEYAYAEYKDYFNYYYVRLVSKDEGVDEVLSDEELKKREEKAKNKSASSRKKAKPRGRRSR